MNVAVNEILERYNLTEPDDIKVLVPRYVPPLTPLQLEQLENEIIPMEDSVEGIETYGEVARFINACRS